MKPRRATHQILAAHRRTLHAHSVGQVRQDQTLEDLAALVTEQRKMIYTLEARITDLEEWMPLRTHRRRYPYACVQCPACETWCWMPIWRKDGSWWCRCPGCKEQSLT